MSEPRIAVVGCGAIGSIIAANLARGGRDVIAVDLWNEHVHGIAAAGLEVNGVHGDFVAHPKIGFLDAIARQERFDIVAVAVKGYDNRWAVTYARDILKDDGVLISTQNGLHEYYLPEMVGGGRVVGCVVPMGGELLGPRKVKSTTGQEWPCLVFGELDGKDSGRPEMLAEVFAPVGKMEVTNEIWSELWGKMTLNVMSNPMSGIGDRTTKMLWSDPPVADVLIGLADETALVARANGQHPMPMLQTIPHELLLAATSVETDAWQEVAALLFAAAERRAGARENVQSLLQDVRKGRRTEIDYLNGVISQMGRSHAIATPVNDLIIEVVHDLERRPASRGTELLSETIARATPLLHRAR